MASANNFEDLYTKIQQTHFEKSLSCVQGWLSTDERKALYALGLFISGPVMEIGSWVGLSTGCIAYGIKESGRSKVFVTTDINPTTKNFREVGDRIGFFLPGDEIPRGTAPVRTYNKFVKPVLAKPGRALGELKKNLRRLGLINCVTIIEGDFANAPNIGYKLIFCDATHTPYQIDLTAQALEPFFVPWAYLCMPRY